MMRNVSHWTLGGRSGRLGLVWEPVITQSETLPERERVLLPWEEKRGEMSRCRGEECAKGGRKKRRKRGVESSINTRITISTTNVSFRDSLFVFSTLFFDPRTYFLDIPFAPLNIILGQASSIRRLRSTRVILIRCQKCIIDVTSS